MIMSKLQHQLHTSAISKQRQIKEWSARDPEQAFLLFLPLSPSFFLPFCFFFSFFFPYPPSYQPSSSKNWVLVHFGHENQHADAAGFTPVPRPRQVRNSITRETKFLYPRRTSFVTGWNASPAHSRPPVTMTYAKKARKQSLHVSMLGRISSPRPRLSRQLASFVKISCARFLTPIIAQTGAGCKSLSYPPCSVPMVTLIHNGCEKSSQNARFFDTKRP